MKQIAKIVLLSATAFLLPEILGSIIDGFIGYFFEWYGIGIAIAIISLILLITFCRRRGIKLLETSNLRQGLIILIPMIISIVVAIIQLTTEARTYDGIKFEFFSLAIMAGVAEEVAFRAIPQSYLLNIEPSEKSINKVVLTTSILFALMHLSNAFGGVEPIFVIYQVLTSFCAGIFFSALFLRTKNVLLPIIMHTVNDFVAFLDVSSISEGLVTSKTFTYLDYIDMAFCVIFLIWGVYLLRPSKQKEIISLWTKEV